MKENNPILFYLFVELFDLASDMTRDSFLLAFRQFRADGYSDNAKSFKRAKQEIEN